MTDSIANCPNLTVSRLEAIRLIDDQLSKGYNLRNKYSTITPANIDDLNKLLDRWNDYNIQLLKKIFDTNDLVNEYKKSNFSLLVDGIKTPYNPFGRSEQEEFFYKSKTLQFRISDKINKLESIVERFPLYDEPTFDTNQQLLSDNPTINILPLNNQKIFIVHGHDTLSLREVERFIEKIGLMPVILNQQANNGKTIIEKLETHSDVGFAVVILSPDDDGKAKTETAYKARARQNVIAELGYFMGKLGRKNTCALYIEGVDIPSDFSGIGYVPMDKPGAWKMSLFKELAAAGYSPDQSKFLEW